MLRIPAAALLALAAALAAAKEAKQPHIDVAASRGEIIPQAKGGGGFQRSFRFSAAPVGIGRWIRQELAVRGTVFDEEGTKKSVHLDVVEYYRISRKGRAIQVDSHYSQFREARGGDLTMESKLTYGDLASKRKGDPIMSKSFILRGATDAGGEPVEMRKRTTGEVIPAERGEKVDFTPDGDALTTRYEYQVGWDCRTGVGSRAEPSGKIEQGTWWIDLPPAKGRTRESVRPRPIPELVRKH